MTSGHAAANDEPLPPHAGLLRDETLILRQLLGYLSPEACSSSPRPALALLKPGDGPSRSPMKDCLLVGLDIDTFQGYERLLPDQQFHVGISILDTRHVEHMLSHPPQDSGSRCDDCNDRDDRDDRDMITSYQFTVGKSKYCKRASNRFLFGTSQPVAAEQVRARIDTLLADRDVVVVSHGTDADLKMLNHLGVRIPNLLYIIDTNKAAQFPLKLHYRYGLEKLLDALQIPFANLHAAGNDAHFCLRVLLMLVVVDAQEQQQQQQMPSDFARDLIELFTDIAQAPRPLTAGEVLGPLHEANRVAKVEAQARRRERRAARTQRRLEQREGKSQDVQVSDVDHVG